MLSPIIHDIDAIVIGASAGGADAIIEVVKTFPENMPCVILVQHMTRQFTSLYAHRLNELCHMEVKEAEFGDKVKKGIIYIAPGDSHLVLKKDNEQVALELNSMPKVNGHRPSVDVTFESAAQVFGKRAIGVILTGMGHDGAKGLLKMRKSGAYTIGQDEKTSMVYGMPRMAKEIGAVKRQLPLDKIGIEILLYLGILPFKSANNK